MTLLLLLLAAHAACLLRLADCKEIPLIVAKDNGLVYVDNEKSSSHQISRLGMPFSVDYIETTSQTFKLFWSDLTKNGIMQGVLQNEELVNVSLFIEVNGARVEGVALDWVTEHIYWVLSDAGFIEVAKLNGEFRRALISGLSSPRALAVDPYARFLFWSDTRKKKSHIQRSSLSGVDIFTVVETADTLGNSINGLTLDYTKHLIYWVEQRSEAIHKITYDGKNYDVIFKQSNLKCPVGIAVYDNKIIWSDRDSGKVIQSANEEENVIYQTYSNLYGIRLLEKRIKRTRTDGCLINNGSCAQLCFTERNAAKCRCAYGHRLASDGKMCEKNTATQLGVIFHYETKLGLSSGIFKQDLKNPIWPIDAAEFYKERSIIGMVYDNMQSTYYLFDSASGEVLETRDGNIKFLFAVSKHATAFAWDYLRRCLFVAVRGSHPHIANCSVDNNNCEKLAIEHVVTPSDIAIQVYKRNLVWLDTSEDKGKILSLNLKKNITNTVAEGKDLCCLTVDDTTDRLWWIDRENSIVISHSQDETSNIVISYSKHFQPISLTVHDEGVYIASTSGIIMIGNGNRSTTLYEFKNKGSVAAIKAFILGPSSASMIAAQHTGSSGMNGSSMSATSSNTNQVEEIHPSTMPIEIPPTQLNHAECVQFCVHEGDCVISDDKELMCRCSQTSDLLTCQQQFCHCVHGDCIVKNDEFTCLCDNGFEGRSCEVPTCNNRCAFGTCSIFANDTAVCSCFAEWEGIRCNEARMQISEFCFNWCDIKDNYTEEKDELCRCHSQGNRVAVRLKNIIIGIVIYMTTVLLLFVIIYLGVTTACSKKKREASLETEQNARFLDDQEAKENISTDACQVKSSGLYFEKLKKLHNKIVLLWKIRLPSSRFEAVQVPNGESCLSTESEV